MTNSDSDRSTTANQNETCEDSSKTRPADISATVHLCSGTINVSTSPKITVVDNSIVQQMNSPGSEIKHFDKDTVQINFDNATEDSRVVQPIGPEDALVRSDKQLVSTNLKYAVMEVSAVPSIDSFGSVDGLMPSGEVAIRASHNDTASLKTGSGLDESHTIVSKVPFSTRTNDNLDVACADATVRSIKMQVPALPSNSSEPIQTLTHVEASASFNYNSTTVAIADSSMAQSIGSEDSETINPRCEESTALMSSDDAIQDKNAALPNGGLDHENKCIRWDERTASVNSNYANIESIAVPPIDSVCSKDDIVLSTEVCIHTGHNDADCCAVSQNNIPGYQDALQHQDESGVSDLCTSSPSHSPVRVESITLLSKVHSSPRSDSNSDIRESSTLFSKVPFSGSSNNIVGINNEDHLNASIRRKKLPVSSRPYDEADNSVVPSTNILGLDKALTNDDRIYASINRNNTAIYSNEMHRSHPEGVLSSFEMPVTEDPDDNTDQLSVLRSIEQLQSKDALSQVASNAKNDNTVANYDVSSPTDNLVSASVASYRNTTYLNEKSNDAFSDSSVSVLIDRTNTTVTLSRSSEKTPTMDCDITVGYCDKVPPTDTSPDLDSDVISQVASNAKNNTVANYDVLSPTDNLVSASVASYRNTAYLNEKSNDAFSDSSLSVLTDRTNTTVTLSRSSEKTPTVDGDITVGYCDTVPPTDTFPDLVM